MTLQEQIKNDLKIAMKEKDEDKKNAIRIIMGEFSRLETKELSDDAVVAVLKKLVKSEKEMMERSGATSESPYLKAVESYLPKMADEAAIRAWVQANIDFSEFRNRMQAMKPVMAHFGALADGNLVKKVLQEI